MATGHPHSHNKRSLPSYVNGVFHPYNHVLTNRDIGHNDTRDVDKGLPLAASFEQQRPNIPKFSWTEPAYFVFATIDRRGWMLRGLAFVGISAVFVVVFLFVPPGNGPQFGVVDGICFALFIGLFLTALIDLGTMPRTVSITEDVIKRTGIGVAAFAPIVSSKVWPVAEIRQVTLQTRAGSRYGRIHIELYNGKSNVVGFPKSIETYRIKNQLKAVGVPVNLDSDVEEHAQYVPRKLNLEHRASGPASIVDVHPPGRVLNGINLAMIAVVAGGPLVIGLLGGIVAAGVVILNWLFGRAVPLLAAVPAFVLFIGGIVFAQYVGQWLAALIAENALRKTVLQRHDAIVNPNDPQAWLVDVRPREKWAKLALLDCSDIGYIKVDAASDRILFEGNQERWKIPANSLRRIEVESYLMPMSDAAQRSSEQCLVVLSGRDGASEWERPVAPMRLEWNKLHGRGEARRVADQLFDEIVAGLRLTAAE